MLPNENQTKSLNQNEQRATIFTKTASKTSSEDMRSVKDETIKYSKLLRKSENKKESETDKSKVLDKINALFNTSNYNFQQEDENDQFENDQYISEFFHQHKLDIKDKQMFENLYSKDNYANIGSNSLNLATKFQQLLKDENCFTASVDPFGIKRGYCNLCKLDCQSYQPVKSLHYKSKHVNPGMCGNCGCGASLHEMINVEYRKLPKEIIDLLYTHMFTNDNLNFDGLLTIFCVENAKQSEIVHLFEFLKEAGFLILAEKMEILDSSKTNNFEQYTSDQIQFNKVDLSKTLTKSVSEEFISFSKTSQISRKNLRLSKSPKFGPNQNSRQTAKVEAILNSTLSNFNKKHVLNICLGTTKNSKVTAIKYFENFLHSTKNYMPKSIVHIYHSKSKISAIWDIQVMFPEIFKLTSSILFLFEKPEFFIGAQNLNDRNSFFAQNLRKSKSKSIFHKSIMDHLVKTEVTNVSDTEIPLEKINNIEPVSQQDLSKSVLTQKKLNETVSIKSKNLFENNVTLTHDQQEFLRNLSLIKDILALNTIEITSEEKFDDIKSLLKKCEGNNNITYINNFCKYISKYDLNNKKDTKSSILYTKKIGTSIFVNPNGITDFLDLIHIKEHKEIEYLSNIFFEESIEYDRILMILRPMIVRNGLSNLILNIFKINGYCIIKRKLHVLTRREAKFVFTFEELDKEFLEEYIHIMSEAQLEFVVLAKFGALDLTLEYELKNDLMHPDDKLRQKIYKEKFQLNPNCHENFMLFRNLFNSVSELVDTDYLVNLFVNKENEKLTKVINNNPVETFDHRKYDRIVELRNHLQRFCRMFNICLYTSKNPKYVEQELAYFFPEMNEMHEIFLILKPNTNKDFKSNIKITIDRLKFEILNTKTHRMTSDEFSELYDIYFDSITALQYSTSKEFFMENDCEIIRMVKPGGIDELNNILGEHSNLILLDFQSNNSDQVLFESKLMLIRNNVYRLTDFEVEYYYDLLEPTVNIIEGNYLLDNSTLIKDVFNSCLKCTIGEILRIEDNLKFSLIERYLKFYHYDDKKLTNDYFINVLNKALFSQWNVITKKEGNENNSNSSTTKNTPEKEKSFEFLYFKKDYFNSNISFLVETNNVGFYEIRIPILNHIINNIICNIGVDMLKIELAKNFLYSDSDFYSDLEKLNNNNEIILETQNFYKLFKVRLQFKEFAQNKNYLKEKFGITKDIEQIFEEEKHFKNPYNYFRFDKTKQKETESYKDVNSHKNEKLIKICKNIRTRIFYRTLYQTNKFIYNTFCKHELNATPNNYHYKICPENIFSPIRRIYEVEEYGGLNFIEIVCQEYMKYRVPEKSCKLNFQLSMPGFLWGSRLATLCNSLIEVNADRLVKNCGPLILSGKDNDEIKGLVNEKYLVEYDKFIYVNILQDIKHAQDLNKIQRIGSEPQFNELEHKLFDILESDCFKSNRVKENLSIMPNRIKDDNLRIIKKKELLINQNIFQDIDQIQGLDPDHEYKFHDYFKEKEKTDINSDSDVLNKTLNIVNTLYVKHSKFRCYAMFNWLLKIQLKILNRFSHLIDDNNENEYDKLIDAIIQGFNVGIDYNIVNDSKNFNSYNVEFFLYGLSEMKHTLNELMVYQQYQIKVSENIEEIKRSKNLNNYALNELQKFESNLKRFISNLNMNLDLMFTELCNFNIKHMIVKKTLENNKDIIYLPKSMFYIPPKNYDKWENDMTSTKYIFKKKLFNPYVMTEHVLRRDKSKDGARDSMMNEAIYKSKNYLRKPSLEKPLKYIPVELNYLTPNIPSNEVYKKYLAGIDSTTKRVTKK